MNNTIIHINLFEENTFYRLLHRHIRKLASIASELEKKTPGAMQILTKEKLRKAKLEFG
jgi:hypothetical protein